VKRHTRVRARLRVMRDGASEELLGVARDVSASGLFLLTTTRHGVGDELALHLRDDECDIHVRARVTRQTEQGVGLEFVGLDDATRAALRRCVIGLLGDGSGFEERRRALRVPLRESIGWAEEERLVRGRLVDLSPRGAHVAAEEPPRLGAKIMLYLPEAPAQGAGERVDPSAVCGCEAMVVRRGGPGFGVRFVDVSDDFAAAVRYLLVNAAGT